MTRKKLILLLISVCILISLGWYTKKLLSEKGKSDTELIEFSLEDTLSIDKIRISDSYARTFCIVRGESGWTQDNGDCITQESVKFILEAAKNVEFKGYLPDKSKKTMINLMSGVHTKVEYFQDGEWVKTWYIGPPAQDHYGQIMLLETAEYGKSDNPVMMKIKGENGIIEPKFFADAKKWMCTKILAVPVENISEVNATFYDEPIRSFKVTKKGTSFSVFQQQKKLEGIDPQKVYLYLQNFKKVHFELANYELNRNQVDSLKRTMPFCKLTVKETRGKSTTLRLFRIRSSQEERNEFGEIVNMDMNKLWCELPNGELVKCQYFVFNPLLLGHIYFPLDLSSRKAAGPQG